MDSSDQKLSNQLYYQEIIKYLENPTQFHKSGGELNWVKIQSLNYFLKDGVLYYGKRKPRRVVVDEESKINILQQIHVDKTKGFHNGVKKMHRLLNKTYFWRYSYKSINEFVLKCSTCSTTTYSSSSEPKKSLITNSPWKQIEFHQFKPQTTSSSPSSENKQLILIYDPVSLWVSASAIKPQAHEMAEFIFENLSNYGVASCTVHGLSFNEFLELKTEFRELLKSVDDVISLENILEFSETSSLHFNDILKAKVEHFLENHPDNWGKRSVILCWLWKLRNEISSNNPSSMFYQCMKSKSRTKDYIIKRRKPTTTEAFSCSSCKETFSTVELLETHESRHTSDGRATRSGSKARVGSSVSSVHQTSDHTPATPPDNGFATSETVAAVKALIANSKLSKKGKDQRHKRGEYHRYTSEIREAIAAHALLHGTHDAARTYSETLGFPVSYSSVRNFVQAHHAFSSQTKLDIGRYAAECGVEAAQKFYTAKLDKSISIALVRKFRRMYLRMIPANQTGSHRKGTAVSRHLFCSSVREEIGKYAAFHGVQAAVKHFSEKLQFSVKESTVRKFKKTFGPVSTMQHHRTEPPEPSLPSSSISHPPPSLSLSSSILSLPPPPQLPPPPPPISIQQHQQPESSNFFHQSYGHYSTPQYVSHQPVNSFHGHSQSLYVMSQAVPPYPTYSALPPPPQYQSSVSLPAYSRNWNEEIQGNQSTAVALPTIDSSSHLHNIHRSLPSAAPPPLLSVLPSSSSRIPSSASPPLPPPLPDAPDDVDQNSVTELPGRLQKSTKKKGNSKKLARGNYATYSPKVRLEIGRFAFKHGCQEASQFFKNKFGYHIPESTIRGLRDKFVAQQNVCEEDISVLSAPPRGRPLRLGVYDSTVQECIRELKRSGERVTPFVAIATARQVLIQKEPSLLSEFGGSLKLTTNWAKSFLKRIGINNRESNLSEQSSENLP